MKEEYIDPVCSKQNISPIKKKGFSLKGKNIKNTILDRPNEQIDTNCSNDTQKATKTNF